MHIAAGVFSVMPYAPQTMVPNDYSMQLPRDFATDQVCVSNRAASVRPAVEL